MRRLRLVASDNGLLVVGNYGRDDEDFAKGVGSVVGCFCSRGRTSGEMRGRLRVSEATGRRRSSCQILADRTPAEEIHSLAVEKEEGYEIN